MSKITAISLSTLIGFGAGILAHSWMTRHAPIPPPPTSVLGELRDVPVQAQSDKSEKTTVSTKASTPTQPARNEELTRQMRSEIDAFRKRLDPLKTEFRQNLEGLLNEEQKPLLRALLDPASAKPSPAPSPTGEKPAPRPPRERSYDGMDSTITLVMVPFTLARLTEELKLTEAQQIEVRQLLLTRRAKFLELVDQTPPPSLKLVKLAPPSEPPKSP